MYPILTLQSAKHNPLNFHHPWLFSKSFRKSTQPTPHGSLVSVVDETKQIVATGIYSQSSMITVRVLEFKEVEINREWFIQKMKSAESHRRLVGIGNDTTGYRLIFGESDGLPGLIVDRYDDSFVIQISTAGMDQLKPMIIDALVALFSPRAIFERSDMKVRAEEKLSDSVGMIYGAFDGLLSFEEYGIPLLSDPVNGQKTGFFLDQRDLRSCIRGLSKNRTVLNLFSYSGSASVMAMKGGAASVLNVDSSEHALSLCGEHARMHGYSDEQFKTECADIFTWLSNTPEEQFDMVIIDPPALIKNHRDVEAGRKAYHFLNRAAMRRVKDNGIFISSSCSSFFKEEDLGMMLKRAAIQSNVELSVLHTIRQAPDHPISIYFPESYYLKSVVSHVRRQPQETV